MAAANPTIQANANTPWSRFMILLVLEALGALALLLIIVWWTMFSGRQRGELPPEPGPDPEQPPKSGSKSGL